MARYVEFSLDAEGTGSIWIEVDDEEAGGESSGQGGVVKAGRRPDEDALVRKATESLSSAADNVRAAADMLISKMRSLAESPDEVEITFGLKASGELGNLAIAKVGAEANYTVKLKWTRK